MKKFLVVLVALMLVVLACACNRQIIDFSYRFNYAVIVLSDGTHIEGKVSSWTDYDDSDMVQVEIDGVTYYTHGSNVLLEAR